MAVIMTNKQQKSITDIVITEGLHINDFIFEPRNQVNFLLKYLPEPDYYFDCSNNIKYCPTPGLGKEHLSKFKDIDDLFKHLRLWAKSLYEELMIGNPWGTVKNDLENTDFSSYELLFTEKEVEMLDNKLDAILIQLKEIGVSENEIKADIEHLKESSRRISVKDWKLLLIGTVSSWVLSGLITSEHVNMIWQIIKTTFLKILS